MQPSSENTFDQDMFFSESLDAAEQPTSEHIPTPDHFFEVEKRGYFVCKAIISAFENLVHRRDFQKAKGEFLIIRSTLRSSELNPGIKTQLEESVNIIGWWFRSLEWRGANTNSFAPEILRYLPVYLRTMAEKDTEIVAINVFDLQERLKRTELSKAAHQRNWDLLAQFLYLAKLSDILDKAMEYADEAGA